MEVRRPQRKSALAAAQQPSFRAELRVISGDDDDDRLPVDAQPPAKKSKVNAAPAKPEQKMKPEQKVKPEPARKKQAKPTGKSHAVVNLISDDDEEGDVDVLLGHVISRCVGIQHYYGNGDRYNKEPLHLRRQPNNRYDPNAIAVYTVQGARQVGHVEAKTGDVAAITRVADGLVGIKLIGQVESGAGQIYKFPLRVSFFGRPSQREAVRRLLGYQLHLHEPPKPRASGKARKKSSSAAAKRGSGAVTARSGGSGAASSTGIGAASNRGTQDDGDDDDDVEMVGERSWAERDAELRKHAIVLD